METPEVIKQQIDAAVAEVKDTLKEIGSALETQKAEQATYGATTKETADKIKSLEERYDNAGTAEKELRKALETATGQYAQLQSRLDEIEAGRKRPANAGGEQVKSIAEQFIDMLKTQPELVERVKSKALKAEALPALVCKDGFANDPAYNHPSFAHTRQEVQKAFTSAGALLQPERESGYLAIPRYRLRIRDLMPVVRTDKPQISYLKELGFTTAVKAAVTSITRTSTTATVTTTAAHGWKTFDLIQISGANQAEYNGNHRITVTGATTFTFVVDVGAVTPATGTIVAARLNNFGAADFVAEGAAKPLGELSYQETIVSMALIAHGIKVTRQSLDDWPTLRADIDNSLLYGLLRKEDRAILYASGVAPAYQGIMVAGSGAQTYSWSQGPVGSGDKKVDAVRRAATLIWMADYEPGGCVLSPKDFEEIELTKGSDGHYLWLTMPGSDGNDRIWRMPLVVTNAMDTTDFLVGAFGPASTFYERQGGRILFSDSDGNDFMSNIITLLAESRGAVAWKRPEAFVRGEFDAAPAAE